MGLLDTYLSYRKSQEARAESLRRRIEDRVQKREDFLADPIKLEQHVARRVATLLPAAQAAEKMTTSTLSPAITVDEAFRKGDPLRGLARHVSSLASDPDYIASRGYDYTASGREIADDIFREEYAKVAIPAFKYKRKQETGLPFLRHETGELPLYEEWRKTEGADTPRKWAGFRHRATPGGVAEAAAMGAGFHLALEGVSRLGIRGVSKLAGRALTAVPAVGPWGIASKLAGAALIAIPEFAMFDTAMDVVRESGWGQAREDEPLKVELASLAAGLAVPGAVTGTARKIQSRVRKASELRGEEVKRGMEIVKRWTSMGYEGEGNTALSILRQEAAKSERIKVAKDINDLESGFSAALKKDPDVFHRVLERLETDIGQVRRYGTPATMAEPTAFGTPTIAEGLDLGVTAAMKPEERLLANRMGLDLFGDTESVRRTSKQLMRGIRKGTGEATVDAKYVNETYRYSLRNLDEEGAEMVMDYMSSGLPKEHAVIKSYRLQQDVKKLIEVNSESLLNQSVSKLTQFEKDWNSGMMKLGTGLRGNAPSKTGIPIPEPAVNWGKHNYKYMPVTNDFEFDIYTRLANQSYVSKSASARARYRHGKITEQHMKAEIGRADKEQWDDIISKWNELESSRGYSPVFKSVDQSTVESQLKSLFPKRFAETDQASRMIRTVQNELIQQAKARIPNDTLDMLKKGDAEGVMKAYQQFRLNRAGKPTRATAEQVKNLKKEQELLKRQGAMQGEAAPDVKFTDVSEALKGEEEIDSFISSITQHHKYLLALATIPVAAFLANDAEAAVSPRAVEAGAKIGALAAKEWLGAFKYGVRSQEQMLKDLIKNKFVSIFGANKYLPEQYMEGVSQMALRKHWKLGNSEIIKNYKGVGPLQTWIMSKPALGGLIYHKWFNPWVEMASRITAAFENTSMDMLAANNILGEVRTLTGKSHREISKAMKPFAEKYYKAAVDADVTKRMVDQIDEDMKPILARRKAGKTADGDLETLASLQKARAMNNELYQKAHTGFTNLGGEWENTVKPLARKYAETRIFLALDDTADFKKYPWLKGMLSREEQGAVSRLRDLLAQKGAAIQKTGERVITGPYVHYAHHPSIDFSAIRNQYKNALTGEIDTIKFAHFHSRSLGAKATMPDIRYSIERYFPDANRRIEVSKFWNSGWRDHMNWATNQSNGLRDFWDDFNKAFRPIEDTKANKLFRNYYSFEVGRLLFLSPSVAHKHFLKQTGNVAMFGPGPVFRNANKAFQAELFNRFSAPQYRNLALDTGKPLSAYEKSSLIKAMSNQGTFNNVINDLDIGDIPRNQLSTALAHWNEKGAVMVDFIEKFDRGNSILMAVEMAGKKGMTPEQAAYSVYDTIIKANFLSGVTNPTWLRNPKIRAFLMFQGTPFKLMEQRVLRTIAGVKAGTNTAKKLWKQMDDMSAIKKQMKGFENEFKANLVMDALNMDTDIFGTNIGKQFMTNVLVLGGVSMTGLAATDSNLWPQLFHPPFIKPGPHQIGIGMSPAVNAAWIATHDKSEDNWYLNTAARQYFANGRNIGVTDLLPVNFRKAVRILQEDYPQLYGEDNLRMARYIFGVPAKGQGHL